jgi:hypothetical protein
MWRSSLPKGRVENFLKMTSAGMLLLSEGCTLHRVRPVGLVGVGRLAARRRGRGCVPSIMTGHKWILSRMHFRSTKLVQLDSSQTHACSIPVGCTRRIVHTSALPIALAKTTRAINPKESAMTVSASYNSVPSNQEKGHGTPVRQVWKFTIALLTQPYSLLSRPSSPSHPNTNPSNHSLLRRWY